MDVERLLLRGVSYVAYMTFTGGLALTLGGWLGWLVALLAAAAPGGYLLRQQVEQQSIERAQRKHAPEQLDRSRLGGGPAPDPVTLPPNY